VGSSTLGWTQTNSEGRYTIPSLASGRTISIGVNFDGGANIDDIPAIPKDVTVAAGGDTSGVDFKVRLDGSISGRVFDSRNEPLPGITVTVFSQEYRSDPYGFTSSDRLLNYSVGIAKVVTDDRGAYSIHSSFLRAGRSYWIYAERDREYGSPISDTPEAVAARNSVIVPTYYPNAASRETATPIILHSLEHRDNVDIHMSSGESLCISGTLTVSGKPGAINFAVESDAMSALHSYEGIPRKGGSTGDDGKIRVCGLTTGTYQLTAFGKGLPNLVDAFGMTQITLSNADLRDVRLDARPPVNLALELTWDKEPPIGTVSPSLRVQGIPTFRPSFQSPATTVPGEISLTTLPSLPLGIALGGMAGALYVKNVELDGRSVLHQSFDPGTGSSRLRITVARDIGAITAQTGKAGTAVIIIPESAMSEAELADTLLAGVTDEAGNYTALQVPPGKYRVLATENPPYSRILYPANFYIVRLPQTLNLLLHNRSAGELVDVSPNGKVQIRVSPKDLQ
jgi:hypothetical protein